MTDIFILKISSIGIYRLLRRRAVSEKLPKILLGSQQHLQIGVILSSCSNWGRENRLAEINLDSTGGDNGF
jgi:hypothetical protein